VRRAQQQCGAREQEAERGVELHWCELRLYLHEFWGIDYPAGNNHDSENYASGAAQTEMANAGLIADLFTG